MTFFLFNKTFRVGQTKPSIQSVPVLFAGDKEVTNVKISTSLYLVHRLRTYGATPLPHTLSQCSVKLSTKTPLPLRLYVIHAPVL
jgi:hypothetical protein